MRSKLALLFLVCPCALQACSHDDNGKEKACAPETFASQCLSEKTHTACIGNVVTVAECTGAQICRDGGCRVESCREGDCVEENSCKRDNFASKCIDDHHRTVCDDRQTVVSEECPENTKCHGGNCVRDGLACNADTFVSKCDNNTLITCDNGEIRQKDCAGQKCVVIEGVQGCFDACSEQDIAAGEYSCVDSDHSKHLICMAIGNGKSIKIEENEDCPFGCNEKTGKCKLFTEEGETCDRQDERRCSNDFIISCNSNNQWDAIFDCANQGNSIPSYGKTPVRGVCEDNQCKYKCSDADVDFPVKQCFDVNLSTTRTWYCKQYGEEYLWKTDIQDDEYCARGCNDEKNACKSMHPEENTPCDAGQETKCADDGILLYCDRESTYHGINCKKNWTGCGETEDGADCLRGCTRAEFDAKATKAVCDPYYDGDLLTYQCKENGSGEYVWEKIDSDRCAHGCDPEHNACVKLHEDEFKPCSRNTADANYYPAHCDGKHYLQCENSKVRAQACSGACHDAMGCYSPCQTLGIHVYGCYPEWNYDEFEGYDYWEYECIEDETHSIMRYEDVRHDSCDGICNPVTGICV